MSFYADKKTHEELKLVLNSIVIKLYVALFPINYFSNKVMCYSATVSKPVWVPSY